MIYKKSDDKLVPKYTKHFERLFSINTSLSMSYTQQLLPYLETKLSPSELQRFLATDGIILEEYSFEFLLSVHNDSWVLSLLGEDRVFFSKEDVYEYFDYEFARLFLSDIDYFIYGKDGLLTEQGKNSALIVLSQTQQEYLALT